MSDISSTNLNSEEFKNKVIEGMRNIGLSSTSSTTNSNNYISGAARPVNVDDDGNIIDLSKQVEEKTEEPVVKESSTSSTVIKYDRGLEDAFNALKKIVRKNHVDGYDEDELNTIFGETDPVEIFSKFNIQTILRNIYEFEVMSLQNKIFNKGDEVLVSEDGYAEDEYDRLVILSVDGDYITGFNSQGRTRKVNKLNCRLTGKTFASLVDIFNKMDEEDQ